jgi:hypothetical protein
MTLERDTLREYLFKESEIVQDIISRMANNQFYIKGWSITLIVASLLLKGNPYHHIVAFVPWLIFWIYDSYFLRLEKMYRAHYTWLVNNRLQSEELLLDLDKTRVEDRLRQTLKERYIHEVPCIPQIMFSKAVFFFYLTLLALILVEIIVEFSGKGALI